MEKLTSFSTLKGMSQDIRYLTFMEELELLRDTFFEENIPIYNSKVAKEFFARFSKKWFAKLHKTALGEEYNPFPDGYAFMIMYEVRKLVTYCTKEGIDYTTDEKYSEIIEDLVKAANKMTRRVAKSIRKEADIPFPIAADIATQYPGEYLNKKNLFIFQRGLMLRLYAIQKTSGVEEADHDAAGFPYFDLANPKVLGTILEIFFKIKERKDFRIRVLSNFALDNQSFTSQFNDAQKRLWDAVTMFTLKKIEKLDIEDIKRFVEVTATKRVTKSSPQAVRINFGRIDREQFPKLYAVINPDKVSMSEFIGIEKKNKENNKNNNKNMVDFEEVDPDFE